MLSGKFKNIEEAFEKRKDNYVFSFTEVYKENMVT